MRIDEVEVSWSSWDGAVTEVVRFGREAGGWTADGMLDALGVQWAARFDDTWQVRQLLVFRDLEDPDLWLATDGRGRWGEVNGAQRPDLDGCTGVHLAITPFLAVVPALGTDLAVGDHRELWVAAVDVDTLAVVPWAVRVERAAPQRLRLVADDEVIELDTDERGLPLDVPGRFRRI